MEEVEDNTIQLIVTSPPYNVGKPYESVKALEEYLEFLNEVWKQCVKKLCRGGRIAINVANTWRQPYIPLHAYIIQQLLQLGLIMRGEIIWDKGPSVGVSTAWGSFASASNPTLRDTHEYILVFSKETLKLEQTQGNYSGIDNLDFVEWTKSIWRFDAESPEKVGHPAPFPIELPKRLILLYTNIGDIVLDPFMGSGTTAVAAKLLGRHYIGYEIEPEYCRIAEKRLKELEKTIQASFLFNPPSSTEIPPPYKEIVERNFFLF